jgi:hypothetical protein
MMESVPEDFRDIPRTAVPALARLPVHSAFPRAKFAACQR